MQIRYTSYPSKIDGVGDANVYHAESHMPFGHHPLWRGTCANLKPLFCIVVFLHVVHKTNTNMK